MDLGYIETHYTKTKLSGTSTVGEKGQSQTVFVRSGICHMLVSKGLLYTNSGFQNKGGEYGKWIHRFIDC